MSLLEPRLSDLRAGFGGFAFSGGAGLPTSPLQLPLWRPPPGPPLSWCTIPNCQCVMSLSRSNILSEMYEYSALNPYAWSSWYLKAAQDPLYKGLALPPLMPHTIERPTLHRSTPDHVEHVDHVDNRSSPGKELPSKISMHERVKSWLELSKPPKYEKEHHTIHRQNSTELSRLPSRSSPTPEHYRNGEPVNISETYSLHRNYLSSHPSLRSPPPHPPPRYPHSRVDLHSPHEGPLNLTVNGNNNNSGSHSPTQSRPSVITCTTLPERDRRYETSSNGSSSPSRRDTNTEVFDPAIEEHFRRSLGKNYPEYLAKRNSSTPSPPPHPVPQSIPTRQMSPPHHLSASVTMTTMQSSKNVSITGSVDDHFARALGDSTWSALKAKTDNTEAAAMNSVDDHFAKALGDTWLRLKDKKEQPRLPGSHPFPLSHPMPHPLPHPIPRAHSLPHPVPQRSTSPSSKSHSGPLLST